MERLPEIEVSSPVDYKESPLIAQSDTKAWSLIAAYVLSFVSTAPIAILLMIPINKLLAIISLLEIPYIPLLLVAFSVVGLLLNRIHKDKWIKRGNIIALTFWGAMFSLAQILVVVVAGVGTSDWVINAYFSLGLIVSLYVLGIPTLIVLIIMIIKEIKKAKSQTKNPSIGLDRVRVLGHWTILSLLSTICFVLIIRSIIFVS